jgi:hypothetical protein
MPKSLNRGKALPGVKKPYSRNQKKLINSPGFKKALAIGTSASMSMAGLFGLGGHLTGMHKGIGIERARVVHLQKAGFRGPIVNKFSRISEVYKFDLNKKEHVDFLRLINVAAKEAKTTPEKVCFYLEKTPKGVFKSNTTLTKGMRRIEISSNPNGSADTKLHLGIVNALVRSAKAAGKPKLAFDLGTHVQKSSHSYSRLTGAFPKL